MKVKSSENYSQNVIIDQNGFLHCHSMFSHTCLWPCQMRRFGFQHLSRVASLHMPWDLTWHALRFPGRDTDPCSEPGWTWICQHRYCVPLHLPNSSIKQKAMLSEIIAVWLTCLQLFPLFPMFRYSLHHRTRHALSMTFLVSFPDPWQSFAARELCLSLSSPHGLLSHHFHLTQPVMLA